MGKVYEKIDKALAEWIGRQRVFFVATAPLDAKGHVNCSPKGGPFEIIDPLTLAYQDYTGSGVETIAHIRENGRIVLMFCAFDGPPRIVRLHGIGEVLEPGHPDYDSLKSKFPENPGTRAIIRVKVTRASDSCGMGVPLYDFRQDRDALDRWALKKGQNRLKEYRRLNNAESIDKLPGLS